MSEHAPEGIVAFDYTSIVKHRGKLFTVGDLSLAKFGGAVFGTDHASFGSTGSQVFVRKGAT